MDGHLKIGPTAIPALGRENYAGFKETSIREIFGIFKSLQSVGRGSTHNLLEILKLELPLLLESSLKKSASQLSSEISQHSEWEKTRSGIRSWWINTLAN
jgi:hypothetical protein